MNYTTLQDSEYCPIPDIDSMDQQFDSPCWFVLRDLKRSNAKSPAYKALPNLGFETFTPMHWVLKDIPTGGKTRVNVPFIHGLLFVKSLKSELDKVIDKTETLQYRFVKGKQQTPMVVPMEEMEQFIKAVTAEHSSCIYYSPEEVKPEMFGKKVRILGGTLDGTTGDLITKRGSKKKRLMLQLDGLLMASVEIKDGLIQFI